MDVCITTTGIPVLTVVISMLVPAVRWMPLMVCPVTLSDSLYVWLAVMDVVLRANVETPEPTLVTTVLEGLARLTSVHW